MTLHRVVACHVNRSIGMRMRCCFCSENAIRTMCTSSSWMLNTTNNNDQHSMSGNSNNKGSNSNSRRMVGIGHYHHHFPQTTIIREFGRKAGRMGHHLQNLEEMAHDQAKAKQGRKKNKIKQQQQQQSKEQEALVDLQNDDIHNDDYDVDDDDDESDNSDLPKVEEVERRMMRLVDRMEESFKSIRGGEPTPEMFDDIQVEAYGTFTPLKSVGQVVIVSPTMATITCFDPSNAQSVCDAVRDAMELNPSIQNASEVRVPLPKVSVETRQALVKQLAKTAEATRQKVRNIRRKAQAILKPAKDGNMEGISQDDAFRLSKQIDTSTDQAISNLNTIVEQKKSSILSI